MRSRGLMLDTLGMWLRAPWARNTPPRDREVKEEKEEKEVKERGEYEKRWCAGPAQKHPRVEYPDLRLLDLSH